MTTQPGPNDDLSSEWLDITTTCVLNQNHINLVEGRLPVSYYLGHRHRTKNQARRCSPTGLLHRSSPLASEKKNGPEYLKWHECLEGLEEKGGTRKVFEFFGGVSFSRTDPDNGLV